MPISYLNPVVEKSMRRLVVYTLLIQDYWLQYFSEPTSQRNCACVNMIWMKKLRYSIQNNKKKIITQLS